MKMNEQDSKLSAIRKRCITSSKVIRVLQIFAIIGIVGAMVGAISCYAFRDTINQALDAQVKAGTVDVENFMIRGGILNFTINYEESVKAGDYATPMTISCLMGVIITSASLFLLTVFKKIFDNLAREDNPFTDSVLSKLKTCFIVITVIMALFVGIGPGVISGVLCWCIYSILEYGKVLQTEVDETL